MKKKNNNNIWINAEILHFNFEKYKICMQNSAELYFAKIIIKTTSLNLSQNAREG